jgi:glycosyltransferase involved in cell wall biosynthesis
MAGHTVELFGMQHPENGLLPYAEHFPEQVDLDPPPGALPQRLRVAAQMFYSPGSRRGLAAMLDQFRPDVVHLHNIYHQLSPSVLRAVDRAGVPAVMTLHDYKLACPSYLMLAGDSVCDACLDGHFRHAVTRRCKDGSIAASALLAAESSFQRRRGAYDPVQLFLCPSRFLAEVMTRAGVYVDRLVVVPNFVDAEAIRPASVPGEGVVYAGRLSPEKGVDILVEAAGLHPTLRVEVFGDGPQAGELKELAARVAPGRVRFHGRLAREQVLDGLRRSAVAVMPSRCHENQPMAVLEAFACGVPVVASALGGLPELVPDDCGALVPPGDPAALGQVLEQVVQHPREWSRRGLSARQRVLDMHAAAGHLEALISAYAEATGRRPGARALEVYT